ncbi:MAG TPA: type IV pilin protein [Burkholderiaceae bacterium]|mgnify:CR=1 FL=1|jgi:type IV pilus assembly protein PilE|nr:type IV pilin protein [Burkholderiaceae bacterium]
MTHRDRPAARRGFTLIELMITVAIVGILAAIAYPSYQDSVRKGKRAEGRSALIDFMQQQERFLTQTGSYSVVTPGQTGVAFKTFSGDNATSPAYKIGAEACPGTPAPSMRECVRVVAVPQFTDDDGGTLRIMSTGPRDCTGAKPQLCWK